MAAKKTDNSNRTYLLEFKNGDRRRLTIPAKYKITFGALIPGSRGGHEQMALRIYETKEKQRACFVNVVGFRDISIPMEKEVIHRRRERAQRETRNGVQDFEVEAKYAEWRSEDEESGSGFDPKYQLPKLVDDEGDITIDDD